MATVRPALKSNPRLVALLLLRAGGWGCIEDSVSKLQQKHDEAEEIQQNLGKVAAARHLYAHELTTLRGALAQMEFCADVIQALQMLEKGDEGRL